jgi:acetyl-CoA C-acetyltransferase
MTSGIRDKVAILGMGCSRFGERWEAGAEALMLEAFEECLADAGIESTEIKAAWLATSQDQVHVGKSALPLSTTLRLNYVPATRVENYCASGTEAFRAAVYAVAAGSVDIALALGVEKLKDTGFAGLPNIVANVIDDISGPYRSAPGMFGQLAHAYRAKHGYSRDELKRALAHISVKSHANGVHSPKAHLRKKIELEAVLSAPIVADPLGLYDCCGVTDGAACAIVTTPDIARGLGRNRPVLIKALAAAASGGVEAGHRSWDGTYLPTTRIAARRAYAEAGISNPRDELDLFEVHDCFSVSELLAMEDLGISLEGKAVHDVLDGTFDADGRLPCQIDGGLKCFGHPLGATGLRMIYEMYLQLLGRAGPRQRGNVTLALTHNWGGFTEASIATVTVLGLA